MMTLGDTRAEPASTTTDDKLSSSLTAELADKLHTKHTVLADTGLLRSVTAEAGEITRMLAHQAKRSALILLMQNAITGYVMAKEGRDNYRGNGHYDFTYIQNSTHLNAHRKQDIATIDSILREAETKALPPINIASALFKYLNTIKTGVNFLWLVRIGKSSDLRTHIHNGIKGFDPMLFWVCFIDQVDDYQSYQSKKPDGAKLLLARSMEAEISKTAVTFEKYQILRKALTQVKRELADTKELNADLEEKNIALTSLINRQKAQITEQGRTLPTLGMAATPRSSVMKVEEKEVPKKESGHQTTARTFN